MDGRFGGGARGDDGVQQDGGFRSGSVGCCGGRGCGGGVAVVGKVVIVFDWLEGGAFAKEAEVVNWDGFGEERVDCCSILAPERRQVCLVGGDTIGHAQSRPEDRDDGQVGGDFAGFIFNSKRGFVLIY